MAWFQKQNSKQQQPWQLSFARAEFELQRSAHITQAQMTASRSSPSITVSVLTGGYVKDPGDPTGELLIWDADRFTLLGSIVYGDEFFSTMDSYETEEEARAAAPVLEEVLRMRDMGQVK
jgi:hypothetical protein